MIERTVTSRSSKRMLRTLRVLSCTSPWKCWVGIFPFLDFVDDSLMQVQYLPMFQKAHSFSTGVYFQ